VEEHSFSCHLCGGIEIMEHAQHLNQLRIISAALNAKRSLPRRWKHLFGFKDLGNLFIKTESSQACASENDCIVLTSLSAKLLDASINVASNNLNL
jgi:hypothetical protein